MMILKAKWDKEPEQEPKKEDKIEKQTRSEL